MFITRHQFRTLLDLLLHDNYILDGYLELFNVATKLFILEGLTAQCKPVWYS